MEYYKLRVDTDNIMELERILLKYSSTYLICQENEGCENPHCHAYLETNTKQATIRNVLRKKYGSGNGSYSLKALDEQYPVEYLAYCIKEKNYRHTLPEEQIEKAKEYDLKVKEEMKKKKAERRTQLQKIEEKYFSNVVDGIDTELNRYVDVEHVADKVIEFYRENSILVREFMMISLIQTLSLKYVNSFDRSFKNRLIEKINGK